ncbi:hypothetical protein I4U23_017362 [Adineta vaga]|nr:hypothetical protein I4U23_017362 [Adineta vaga]
MFILTTTTTTSHIPESNCDYSYTQSVNHLTGSTVKSKVFNETSTSSANDIPSITSLNQRKDNRTSIHQLTF